MIAHVNRVVAEQPAGEHRRQDQQRRAGAGQQHEQRAARGRRTHRHRQRHQHAARAAEGEQQNHHGGGADQGQQRAQVAHHQPAGQLHHRPHPGIVQRNAVLLRQPALQRVEPLHQHRRRQPRAQFQVEGRRPEVGAPVRVNLREPFVGRAQLRRHPLVIPFQQRRRHERTHHDVELGGPHHGGAQRRGVAAQPLHGAQERVHLRQDGQVVRIQPVTGAVAELYRHRHHVLALRRQHGLIGRPAGRRRHLRRPTQRRQQHQQRRRHRHRRQHHPPPGSAHRCAIGNRQLPHSVSRHEASPLPQPCHGCSLATREPEACPCWTSRPPSAERLCRAAGADRCGNAPPGARHRQVWDCETAGGPTRRHVTQLWTLIPIHAIPPRHQSALSRQPFDPLAHIPTARPCRGGGGVACTARRPPASRRQLPSIAAAKQSPHCSVTMR